MPRQPLVQARHQCGAASTGANRNERPAPGGTASELTGDPSKQISEEARLVLRLTTADRDCPKGQYRADGASWCPHLHRHRFPCWATGIVQ